MPLHYRLADLPARFHKQVEEQLRPLTRKNPTLPKPDAPKNPDRPLGRPSPIHKTPKNSLSLTQTPKHSRFHAPHPRNLRANKMTKPEIAFNRDFLDDHGLYEGITLKLPGGSAYTPDFLCLLDGHPTVVECKGSFRLQSEGRAHTAFFEAAANYSWLFTFVWAVYQKGGKWDIKHVIPSQPQQPPNNNINNIYISGISGVVGSREEGEPNSQTPPVSPVSPNSTLSPSSPLSTPTDRN